MRGLAYCVLLGGCNALLGIEDPTLQAARIRITHRWAENSPTGALVVMNRAVTEPIVARIDGVEREVTADAGEYLVFPSRTTGTYDLLIPIDGDDRELQSGERELDVVLASLGRRERRFVTMPTRLAFPDVDPVADAVAYSTGAWGHAPALDAQTGGQVVQWDEAPSGQNPLLDSDLGDRLYLASYSTIVDGGLTYKALTALGAWRPTFADGETVLLRGTPMQVVRDRCATFQTRVQAELDRVAQAFPGSQNPNSMWSLSAAPAGELAGLATAELASASPVTADDTRIQFNDPFPNTVVTAGMVVTRQVQMVIPDAGTYNITQATNHITRIEGTACADPTGLGTPVALARAVTIDGRSIGTDFPTISITNAQLEVEWDIVDGSADFYRVAVLELDPASAAPVPIFQHGLTTLQQHARLPTSWFHAGGIYQIQIRAAHGFPGASTGDFANVQYPIGFSQVGLPFFRAQ